MHVFFGDKLFRSCEMLLKNHEKPQDWGLVVENLTWGSVQHYHSQAPSDLQCKEEKKNVRNIQLVVNPPNNYNHNQPSGFQATAVANFGTARDDVTSTASRHVDKLMIKDFAHGR